MASDSDEIDDVSVEDREKSARRAMWFSTLLVAFLFAALPFAVLVIGLGLHSAVDDSSRETSTTGKTSDSPASNSSPNKTAPTPEFESIDRLLRKASTAVPIEKAEQSIKHLDAAKRDWQRLLDQTLHDDIGKRIASNEPLLLQFIALQAMPQPEHDSPELNAVLDKIRDASSSDSPQFDQLAGAASELAQIAVTAFAFHEARRGTLEKIRAEASNAPPAAVDLATKLFSRAEELERRQQQTTTHVAASLKTQLQTEQRELSNKLAENRNTIAGLSRQLERLQLGQPFDQSSSETHDDLPVASREDYQRESDKIRTILKPFITPGFVQPESADKLAYQNAKQPVSFSALKRIGALQATPRGIEILFRVGGSKTSSYQNDRPLGSFPRMNSRSELQKSEVIAKVREAQRLLRAYGPYLVGDGLLSP